MSSLIQALAAGAAAFLLAASAPVGPPPCGCAPAAKLAACDTSVRPSPLPRAGLSGLVGQYGDAKNILDISEDCGKLFANGRGFSWAGLTAKGPGRFEALTQAGQTVSLAFDRSAPAHFVMAGSERLERHDFGEEVQAGIRASVHADPDKVRAAALAAKPPVEPTPKRPSDLVSVPALDPDIHFRTIYATTDNFMGIPIYERAGAYMQRPAAEALVRAAEALKSQGYGLYITDAYRPWYATKMFWDATPPEDHNFVADPSQGSRHNRGCAVDLTLYDLKTGKPVEMTGRIDEMSARSFANYPGGTSRQRWFRALLRREMEKQGFAVYSDEWWHFDYKDWPDYGIGTATYTELAAGKAH
jgi:D-alanyl-D-alanine dipeptidase